MSPFIGISLFFIISFAGCSEKKNLANRTGIISCSEYDWHDIEAIVEPYVSEELYVSLVMQAQSSEYKVSSAAEHALGLSTTYPDSVVSTLKQIIKLNC